MSIRGHRLEASIRQDGDVSRKAMSVLGRKCWFPAGGVDPADGTHNGDTCSAEGISDCRLPPFSENGLDWKVGQRAPGMKSCCKQIYKSIKMDDVWPIRARNTCRLAGSGVSHWCVSFADLTVLICNLGFQSSSDFSVLLLVHGAKCGVCCGNFSKFATLPKKMVAYSSIWGTSC